MQDSIARKLTVRGVVDPAIRDFQRHAGTFVAYGILLKILNAAVIAPLLALLYAGIVRWGGDHVLSNEEIFEFFLTPVGVLALVALLMTASTTTMTEQAGIMIIFANKRARRPMHSLRALSAMLRKLPGILTLNMLRAVAVLLCAVPFAAIGAGYYSLYLSGYDLNYLVQVRPAPFWWGATVVALLVLGFLAVVLFFHVRMMYAFPAYFFGGRSLTAALREGFTRVGQAPMAVARVLVSWLLTSVFLHLVLDLSLDPFGEWVLGHTGNSLAVVAIVVGLLLTLQLFCVTALSLFTVGVNAIILARCYLILSPDHELVVPTGPNLDDGPKQRTRLAVWSTVLVFLVLAAGAAYAALEQSDLEDDIVITAHRGSSLSAPENTISAILVAAEDGADYAEIDVQETADGRVVVIHDTDLKRIAGLDKKIWQATYEELLQYDIGSWFGPEFAGERIPTLAQAIDAAKGRIDLNIEIKVGPEDRHLIDNVVRTIREKEFGSQCIVTSLSFNALQEVARLDPTLLRGYIVYQALGGLDRIDADQLMVGVKLANTLALSQAHGAGKQVHVWTINDARQMSIMIDRGVDGILTDDPRRLVAVLEERAELNDLERLLLRFQEFVAR